ncbi:MAG TPA: translation initiation factor IF-3 [Candidatus Limnocylindrales bacterium]|nr:translation initiation factor IF-3 [Candidatus Limnocylindrales bacterium]
MAAPELRINDMIRVPAVRLIGPNGEQLGVLPTQRALAHAQDLGYDLVEIAPNAVPPVAKILDFGKYRFEKQQEAKEAKKRQKSVIWKEVRLSPKIDEHDVETKIKSATKFLGEGDKLKITVRFRGREMAHPDRGRVLLMQMAERLKDQGTVERLPLLEGRSMSMVMNPLRGAGAPPTPPPNAPMTSAPRPAPAPGTRPAPGLPRTPGAPPAAAPTSAAPAAAAKPSPAAAPAAPRAASNAPAAAPRPAAPRPAAPRATTARPPESTR